VKTFLDESELEDAADAVDKASDSGWEKSVIAKGGGCL